MYGGISMKCRSHPKRLQCMLLNRQSDPDSRQLKSGLSLRTEGKTRQIHQKHHVRSARMYTRNAAACALHATHAPNIHRLNVSHGCFAALIVLLQSTLSTPTAPLRHPHIGPAAWIGLRNHDFRSVHLPVFVIVVLFSIHFNGLHSGECTGIGAVDFRFSDVLLHLFEWASKVNVWVIRLLGVLLFKSPNSRCENKLYLNHF